MYVAFFFCLQFFLGQSYVTDIMTKINVTDIWLEIGFFQNLTDNRWTAVTTIESFIDPVVFIALPENGGVGYEAGTAMSVRLHDVVVNDGGTVTFDAKLFTTNDSYCLESDPSITWTIPERTGIEVEQVSWLV